MIRRATAEPHFAWAHHGKPGGGIHGHAAFDNGRIPLPNPTVVTCDISQ
jgi:hypothetical protein